jgi:hypothetical protein
MKPAAFDRALAAREAANWMRTWDQTVRGKGRAKGVS